MKQQTMLEDGTSAPTKTSAKMRWAKRLRVAAVVAGITGLLAGISSAEAAISLSSINWTSDSTVQGDLTVTYDITNVGAFSPGDTLSTGGSWISPNGYWQFTLSPIKGLIDGDASLNHPDEVLITKFSLIHLVDSTGNLANPGDRKVIPDNFANPNLIGYSIYLDSYGNSLPQVRYIGNTEDPYGPNFVNPVGHPDLNDPNADDLFAVQISVAGNLLPQLQPQTLTFQFEAVHDGVPPTPPATGTIPSEGAEALQAETPEVPARATIPLAFVLGLGLFILRHKPSSPFL